MNAILNKWPQITKFNFLLLKALFFIGTVSLAGCTTTRVLPSSVTPAITSGLQPSESPYVSSGLFLEANGTREVTPQPQIIRSRFVTIDPTLLMDEAGRARTITEIPIDLFPDAVYTGVIEQIEQNGDSISWSGYLKDIENSYFTLVFTSGVYMGHFASPLGIYETGFIEPGLYRIIQIDQTKFPGGEG